MTPEKLLASRGELEGKLRSLVGRPVMVIELDLFALPCGCAGITANTRGLEYDDLQVFEAQLLPFLKETGSKIGVAPEFIFARLVPGSSIVASLNWRLLCKRCSADFTGVKGRVPRPDLYILFNSKK